MRRMFAEAPSTLDISEMSSVKSTTEVEVFDGVEFKSGRVVHIKEQLGEGCTRRAYSTGYIENGVEYIVKESKDADGDMDNWFEYHIYQKAKGTPLEEDYPVFLDISTDGCYLLVERCVTLQDSATSCWDTCETMNRIRNSYFDAHDGNVGYTLKDNRPVIMDLGHETEFPGVVR